VLAGATRSTWSTLRYTRQYFLDLAAWFTRSGGVVSDVVLGASRPRRMLEIGMQKGICTVLFAREAGRLATQES